MHFEADEIFGGHSYQIKAMSMGLIFLFLVCGTYRHSECDYLIVVHDGCPPINVNAMFSHIPVSKNRMAECV